MDREQEDSQRTQLPSDESRQGQEEKEEDVTIVL
jgi:hypothetical protein